MRGTLSLLLLAAAVVGCDSKSSKGTDPVVAAPVQGQAPPAPSGPSVTGKVLEQVPASPYVYLRLQTAQGEVWAAVPETKVETGAEVTVADAMPMKDFESKTMKRTFAEIYFGTLGTPGAAAPAPTGTLPPSANPHGGLAAPTAVEVGKVEKATGPEARTVAEAWAQKGALKEKPVVIRGKVVKYNAGVMGKNWIHLQDGSGDPAKGTHDITFTSMDQVAKGDTVTLRGILRTDKDFGSGYTYAVILEEAKVVKR